MPLRAKREKKKKKNGKKEKKRIERKRKNTTNEALITLHLCQPANQKYKIQY